MTYHSFSEQSHKRLQVTNQDSGWAQSLSWQPLCCWLITYFPMENGAPRGLHKFRRAVLSQRLVSDGGKGIALEHTKQMQKEAKQWMKPPGPRQLLTHTGARAAGDFHCQGSGSNHTECCELLTAEDEQLLQKEKSSGLTVSPVTLYHLTQLAQTTGV